VKPSLQLAALGLAAVLLSAAAGLCPADEPPGLRHSASAMASPPARSALDSRLQEILSRPDFRHAMDTGGSDPRALARWLWLQLRRLLARLGGLHETNYALFLVAVIAGVAVLIPLLAHVTYTLARFLGRQRSPGRDSAGPASPPRPVSPAELIREAERHAAAGRYREAVRGLYLALHRSLQLRGLLPRTSSQTNWECVTHLSSTPRVLTLVRPFTQTFDEKWYGGRTASAEDVSRCRDWLAAVMQEVEAA